MDYNFAKSQMFKSLVSRLNLDYCSLNWFWFSSFLKNAKVIKFMDKPSKNKFLLHFSFARKTGGFLHGNIWVDLTFNVIWSRIVKCQIFCCEIHTLKYDAVRALAAEKPQLQHLNRKGQNLWNHFVSDNYGIFKIFWAV